MLWNNRKKVIVSALPMFTCYMYCVFRNKWFIENGFVGSFLFFGTPFVELIWFSFLTYMCTGYVVCTGS